MGTKIVVIMTVIIFIYTSITITYFAYVHYSNIENDIRERAVGRLQVIEAIHVQSMLNRLDKSDNDPAITILDDTFDQLSKSSKDMDVWLTMGPKVLAFQKSNSKILEPPVDKVGREAISSKRPVGRIVGDNYRLTVPVILGQGLAINKKCFACHGKDMGLISGDVIGAYSLSMPLNNFFASVTTDLINLLFAALALVIIVAASCQVLIKRYYGRPITVLNQSMTELAGGGIDIIIPNIDRQDEIGDMSNALLVFQKNLAKRQEVTLQLSQAHANMEQQVKERTEELQNTQNNLQHQLIELDFHKKTIDEHAIISVTDVKGNITYANRLFSEISGYSTYELIGKNHRILKSGEHSDEFYSDLWKTIVNGDIWHGEIKNKTKTGGFYWVRATIVPFLNKKNKPVQYYGIRTDITEHKNNVIKQQNIFTELEAAKNTAESANKIKSEFLAAMSHEIRTPMAGIIGMTDLLMDSELTPIQLNWITHVKKSSQNLLVILNEILDQSKLEAGKLNIDAIDFHVPSFIHDITDLFAPSILDKGLTFDISLADDLPLGAHADQMRIGQILSNLLSNALKFTEKGTIHVSVNQIPHTDGSFHLKISVTDTGIGIKQNACDQLFTPFVQADGSTSRTFGGTGLGLSISKQLSEMMEGEIHVTSEIGKGSAFSFTVLCKQPVKPVSPPDRRQSLDRWVASKPLDILIAEDNMINQQLLLAIFKKLDHHVTIVNNGQAAVGIVSKNEFDLVLMDIRMPIMDGLQATKLIRSLKSTHSTLPIIALTADVSSGNVKEYMDVGINEVCVKPVNLPSLLKTINRILGEDIHSSIPPASIAPDDQLKEVENQSINIDQKVLPFEETLKRIEAIVDQLDDLDEIKIEAQNLQGLDVDLFAQLVEKYEVHLNTCCNKLNGLFIEFSNNTKNNETQQKLKALTHTIKGGGGSFGYHLVTLIATEADHMLSEIDNFTSNDLFQLNKYIDALLLISSKKISGHGGKPGRILLEALDITVQ